ncbi:MAG: class II aldolase [Lachnospiraceae bacterium]|nr:class II aldolase [Lachnospiraceae bacterium]
MKGFVKISRYAGMREDLVQAGGGNTSFKISDTQMIIKASGYQLSDITEETGYAKVDHKAIEEFFMNCKDPELLTEQDGKRILEQTLISGKRPSIETFLHSISGRYTLHTHPVVVNVLTCRKGGMEVLKELFPEAMLVPYATPGIELAKAYYRAFKDLGQSRLPEIVFLQNHGLVVSADNADAVIEKTEEVTRKIEVYLGKDQEGYHDLTILWNRFPDKIVWKVTDSNILNTYNRQGGWEHAFCPDCVVFLGKKFLKLQKQFSQKDIELFCERYGMPVVVEYNSRLYILADGVKKALEIQSVMSFSAQVMAMNTGYECEMLSEQEMDYLLNWDSEKYRKQIK